MVARTAAKTAKIAAHSANFADSAKISVPAFGECNPFPPARSIAGYAGEWNSAIGKSRQEYSTIRRVGMVDRRVPWRNIDDRKPRPRENQAATISTSTSATSPDRSL